MFLIQGIQNMNISKRDLNLLYLFKVLYEEQNLTLAAERMRLSQPAMSHKLAKLRTEFGDPLFVRASRGLTPTPKAHRLARTVMAQVSGIERFYSDLNEEDFLAKEETVHIHTTDFVEQTLMPGLIKRVAKAAPGITIVSHNTLGRLPKEALENGQCDIAIAGFFRNLPDTFYQQALAQTEFVVLARADHPKIGKRLTLKQFLTCQHLVTTLTGDLDGLVDQALAKSEHQRKVVAGMSSFLAPPMVIKETELVLTCLRPIAEQACQHYPELTTHRCPVPLDPIEINQYWHQRSHHDPIRAWLRQQIWEVMQS